MPQCILGGRISWTSTALTAVGTLDALHLKQHARCVPGSNGTVCTTYSRAPPLDPPRRW